MNLNSVDQWCPIRTVGAWSTEPFGNDTANDWKYSLEEAQDLSFIEQTLDKVHETGDDYLEAPEAEEAIAAADTLARLRGKFSMQDAYTESVDRWVANHPIKPSAKLIESAIRALDRIQADPSELLELWKESEDFESWKKSLSTLKEHLLDD